MSAFGSRIARTLVGSLGLIAAVPLTTAIAAGFVLNRHRLGKWEQVLGAALPAPEPQAQVSESKGRREAEKVMPIDPSRRYAAPSPNSPNLGRDGVGPATFYSLLRKISTESRQGAM